MESIAGVVQTAWRGIGQTRLLNVMPIVESEPTWFSVPVARLSGE